jgi:GNAT superfamily N-acetyltransferase
MTAPAIRHALRDDEASLHGLADRLAAFGPTTRSAAEIAIRERKALTDALIHPQDGQRVLVAEQPGQGVVGVIFLEKRSDYFTGVEHGHIAILSVAEQAQGKGVAGALLLAAEDWARERGYARMTLNVFAGNERALRAYSRNGWEPEFLTYFKNLDSGSPSP